MFVRALDVLVRPQVSKFVHRWALRMHQAQLLEGAAVAARIVIGSFEQALATGDAAPLAELYALGCLETRLHDHLAAELQRAQEQQAGGGVADIVNVASQQKRQIENATPSLETMTLVVGCQRDGFNGAARHRLAVGSHLEIVGQPRGGDAGLWRQKVQQDLLKRHGCTVHCAVTFGAAAAPPAPPVPPAAAGIAATAAVGAGSPAEVQPQPPPQRYTFEACVSGVHLMDESRADELTFVLVDINGVLRGNRFWTTAEEVRPFWASQT
jgi:hypothetical protein